MEMSPTFLKLRTIAFSLIVSFSFAWTVLLCVMISFRWEVLDLAERSFLAVMLIEHIMTVIILLILIIVEFRPWLDAARFFLLLVIHIGISSAFAYWHGNFRCPHQTPDEEGICKLLNLSILLASWIIPILLILYTGGLILMLYRRRIRKGNTQQDPESTIASAVLSPRSAYIPSGFVDSPASLTFPIRVHANPHSLRALSMNSMPRTPISASDDYGKRASTRTSRRLSKPVPFDSR